MSSIEDASAGTARFFSEETLKDISNVWNVCHYRENRISSTTQYYERPMAPYFQCFSSGDVC